MDMVDSVFLLMLDSDHANCKSLPTEENVAKVGESGTNLSVQHPDQRERSNWTRGEKSISLIHSLLDIQLWEICYPLWLSSPNFVFTN